MESRSHLSFGMARLFVVLALASLEWSDCISSALPRPNHTNNTASVDNMTTTPLILTATPSTTTPLILTATPSIAAIVTTTTNWFCHTPLCMGLVGAAAGTAGVATIGSIVAVTWPKNKTKANESKAMPARNAPKSASNSLPSFRQGATDDAPSSVRARNSATTGSPAGSDWLIPVAIVILLLVFCCGITGYFYCKKRKRRPKPPSKRTSKITPPAPEPEITPLNSEKVEEPERLEETIFDNANNFQDPSMFLMQPDRLQPVFMSSEGMYGIPGPYDTGGIAGPHDTGGVYATPTMVNRVFTPPGMYQQHAFY